MSMLEQNGTRLCICTRKKPGVLRLHPKGEAGVRHGECVFAVVACSDTNVCCSELSTLVSAAPTEPLSLLRSSNSELARCGVCKNSTH